VSITLSQRNNEAEIKELLKDKERLLKYRNKGLTTIDYAIETIDRQVAIIKKEERVCQNKS